VPAVAQTPGAIAGLFKWGPVLFRTLIGSEQQLVTTFGKPTNYNPETWFTAANFLDYGGNLEVVRAGSYSGNSYYLTAVTTVSGNNSVAVSPTTNFNVGQVLAYVSNTSALNPQGTNIKVTVTAVNSTALTFSTPFLASNGSVNLLVRDDTLYSSVGQDSLNYNINWASQAVPDPLTFLSKVGTFDSSVQFVARYPGLHGNSIRVAQVDTASEFQSNTNLLPNAQINATATFINAVAGSNTITVTVTPANTANATNVTSANVVAGAALASLALNDLVQTGNATIGQQFLQVTSLSTISLNANVFSFTIGTNQTFNLVSNVSSNTLSRYWEFFNLVKVPPGQSTYQLQNGNTAANDELHIVVVDQLGKFTGTPGTLLETYQGLSRATDSKLQGGQTNYYQTVINQDSQWIYAVNDRTNATSNTAAGLASSTTTAPFNSTLTGGADGPNEANVSLGIITQGYDLFNSAELVDVGLVMQGKARGIAASSNSNLAGYLINNIAEVRKDCVVFASPDYQNVVNNVGFEASSAVTYAQALPSSSYCVLDSGYKYMYDKYNDLYRWVPLNGDIAGLCARTDQTNDPWWSPAGFNRGNIKNVAKLAWNPRQSDRDTLYASAINPVASFPGLGTVLFGDKTKTGKPSAFDRINVRRLFITLEKAIATAAKFTLFEFNDPFTRAQFRAMVNPYLADIKGRRGIQDFVVVCDATNNTPEIIDTNQFKAAMYIKPARSINWIILDFVAVPTGVSFNEVIGQYGG
jgi:hypothetical protein